LKQSVTGLVRERLPLTLKLMALSFVLSTALAIPLGVVSALHKNRWIDHAASFVSLVGVSAPVYFSGVAAVLIFAYWLRWLPAFGTGKGLWDELYHLILPATVLALTMMAWTARMTRSAMLEALSSDYIVTARAKGLPTMTVVVKHALRNALIPVVTVASLQIGFLVVGSVLVEYTFGLGGLGSLITDAVQNRDYPVIQGTVLFLVVMFTLLNLATDLLYAIIDPRIRLSRPNGGHSYV
jgi:peptide/nickel transport system permease protein